MEFFCHVTHAKTEFSEIIFSDWRPCLFFWHPETVVEMKQRNSSGLKRQNIPGFWSTLVTLFRGFFAWPTILKAEKALGMKFGIPPRT